MYIELAAKLCGRKVRVKVDKEDYTSFDLVKYRVIVGNDIGDDPYSFYEHLVTKHKCDFAHKYNYKTWSFLHEVGHFYTIDDVENFDDGEYDYFDAEKEWVATEWAITFAAEHPRRMKVIDWLIKHSKVRDW